MYENEKVNSIAKKYVPMFIFKNFVISALTVFNDVIGLVSCIQPEFLVIFTLKVGSYSDILFTFHFLRKIFV